VEGNVLQVKQDVEGNAFITSRVLKEMHYKQDVEGNALQARC